MFCWWRLVTRSSLYVNEGVGDEALCRARASPDKPTPPRGKPRLPVSRRSGRPSGLSLHIPAPLLILSLSSSPLSVFPDIIQVTPADLLPLESPDGCGCPKASFMPRSPWVLLVPRARMPLNLCLRPGSQRRGRALSAATGLLLFSCRGLHAGDVPPGETYPAFHRPPPVASESMAEGPTVLHGCPALCSRGPDTVGCSPPRDSRNGVRII